jgi:hypothetical protein
MTFETTITRRLSPMGKQKFQLLVREYLNFPDKVLSSAMTSGGHFGKLEIQNETYSDRIRTTMTIKRLITTRSKYNSLREIRI